MGNYISNQPISCPGCGCGHVPGREESYTDRNGNIVHECSWVCPQCGVLLRRDENVEEKQNEKL